MAKDVAQANNCYPANKFGPRTCIVQKEAQPHLSPISK